MSQNQNSPCISLETSVSYLHFQVRFSLAMLWTSRLDTAAKETWIRGQFSPYREWYGLLIYNTYPIPAETPHLSGGEISHLAINFKRSVRVGNNNIPFGFRRQTCEKLWYLNIYLRFALINLFYISISFSPVILKGTINPQSSENEILEYSSRNFATLNSVLNRFALNFTESLPLLFYCN